LQEEQLHLVRHCGSRVSYAEKQKRFDSGNCELTHIHRNAEEMLTEKGTPKTSHTLNKVPFVMANAPASWSLKKEGGVLGDVAPTVLAAMGVEQPEEMSGTNLLVKS
jgi:2,3-bisphosphoglycerate-independent phosphoglycerate mutase